MDEIPKNRQIVEPNSKVPKETKNNNFGILMNNSSFEWISVLFGNGEYLACVCYIHCFFIIVRLEMLQSSLPLPPFFPASYFFSWGIFPLSQSIVVLWGTIADKWLPIKIVFCCPHLLRVIKENEAQFIAIRKNRILVLLEKGFFGRCNIFLIACR